MRRSRQNDFGPASGAGFTLIELVFVMLILALGALFVAPSMSSFFHGRVLSSEARRLLAVMHHGQSRAIAEGVPVILWLDAKEQTYGLSAQNGSAGTAAQDSRYTLDPSLTLEIPASANQSGSELDDERLGISDNLAFVRFLPGGFYDEGSAARIILHQGEGGGMELVPDANRLSYEIIPLTLTAN